jgi:pimeloyl-ACP methyl ester carboxylesterase
VILADATFAYYREGNLIERLHDEVVAPALRAGYRKVWLTGASLGGMGALLYEQQHPGEMAGIVLFAPFLGDRSLLREIDSAGGPRAWNPGRAACRGELGKLPAPGVEDDQGLDASSAARTPRLARLRRRGSIVQQRAPAGEGAAAGPFRRTAGRPYLGSLDQRRQNRVCENQERIMKLATFQTAKGASYGVVSDKGITDLGARLGSKYPDLKALISKMDWRKRKSFPRSISRPARSPGCR